MSDQQFQENFRMPKGHFQMLHEKLVTTNAFQCFSKGKPPVNSEKCLCIGIWVLANPDHYRSVASRFKVAKSTVVTCLRRVIDGLLNDVCQNAIKLPRNEAERREIAQEFEEIAGMENVIGSIDGCHIKIKAPAREDKHVYFNRKKDYSIVLQGLCDANSFFTNVDIRWPGSVHDSRAFMTSDLFPLCEQLCANRYHIIGDSAYPLKRYLMRPYRRSHRLNARQKLFNKVLSKSRVVIERAFGFLKNRFRRLYFLHRMNVEDIVSTILACCILHNICLANEEYARELIFGNPDENHIHHDDQNYVPPNENPNVKRRRISNRIWELYH